MSIARVLLAALFLLTPILNAKEEDEKWSVAEPPDETYEIEIDTDEGTWMSLDVSPDGKWVVFDMLGDIYRMPITGGEATVLAGGLPWEMQPRFSPDGKSIAFTSDRGGGDNIWIMDADGSNPQQVTKESFRLLNSPVWSPDGQYLAARKHFTKTRSLGAGEIWLYHRSGGGGLQMVEKPNDQQDLGEPAFSPDGRYVYYSQDTTPGPTFQYSKDPTPGIYSIKRLDRETGDIETYISGMGGAIRPTPSPDGKTLAFIRRLDYKTTLFLHDIESGANTPLYDGLDRDLQETWAIHGVYAGIAWTPDNASLVFWAGGKIHRLDVKTGKDSVIPFHVKNKHTMVKPLRYPVSVAPDEFDVSMLRWTAVSPKGDKVVYSALGYLYSKDLPNGEPKRLTKQTDHFEYYPSFSRDGKTIVYISWNDKDLGAVRSIPATGGESKRITQKPGHYLEPAFSPDGAHIAYRKTGGGYVTSPLWSSETGIYVVPSAGGDPVLVSKRGTQPHFGAASDRVYFLSYGREAMRTLNSVDLLGNEAREHAENAAVGEYRISPDGKWLAFSEPFRVYIAPMVQTGGKISLGPKSTSIPVSKVSSNAGEYLHWSGDSSRLYWSHGNQLYQRDLKDSFAFLEGAAEELPEPEAEGKPIGFKHPYYKPQGLVAIEGARIITMKGVEVIEDGVVLVEDNRIKAIGSKDDVKIPRKAKRVDVSGKTIIPGLVDVHAHGPYGAGEVVPQQNWAHYAGLTFGVTTVHDPSSDTSTIFSAAEMAKAGHILAPRIFSTGTILYGAKAPGATAKIDSLDDARFHLRRMKEAGAISVKSYNQPRRNQRQQVIKAAREMEMMVVPEGGSLFQHNMTMIADGHTGVEHSIPMAAVYSDVVQFWSKSETGYTPTLGVGYGGIWGENYWYDKEDVWKHPRLSKFTPDYILEPRSRRRTKAPDKEYNHFRNAEVCKKLSDAGVKVNLGAHGQREGLAAHWEVWMLAQGGMTPHEALRAGTLNGAWYLGLDKDLGSLEPGKLADLIILDKNPLDNIRNTEAIQYVMLNGYLYDSMTMNRIGDEAKNRAPFFFEGQNMVSPNTAVHAETTAKCGGLCNH